MESSCLAGHFLIAMPAMVDPNFQGIGDLFVASTTSGGSGGRGQSTNRATMESLLEQIEIEVSIWRCRNAKFTSAGR